MKEMTPLTAEEVTRTSARLQEVQQALQQVLFGQEELIEKVLISLLAGGHVLLEGLPGLGKTELVRSLGSVLALEETRIQFTPDLLPGDITGNPMIQEVEGQRVFVFQKGPLFGNLVLADEINRASPKTQAALLEAMQEHRVTSMGERHPLPEPFFVLATQNPIELEGTYPLPEAQLDRFLFKLNVQMGGTEVLQRIVQQRELGREAEVSAVLKPGEWERLMEQSRRIYLPEVVANLIARIVSATHPEEGTLSGLIKVGASPRAAIGLAAAGKARALLRGSENVDFTDIRAVGAAVLQHRILLEYHAKLEGRTGASVAQEVLDAVPNHPDPLPPLLAERTSS